MRLLLAFFILTGFSSCYLARAYNVRKFQLTDHERLPFVTIQKSNAPYRFIDATAAAENKSLAAYLDTNLAASHTAAFIVIRNDSVLYERYFNGFSQASLLPSFSVAKSYVGTLVAIAVNEGKIKTTAEPITAYLPELAKRDARFSRITVQHLLDMQSGIKFNEGSYGLKDDAIKLGFRPNLLKHALKLAIEEEPGKEFEYKSINTELLALIVERATGRKLSRYMQEKLWQPMGAEYNATWNVDNKKHQQEIAFAGLNATARDFAKLGQLYLNGGQRGGVQILNPAWVLTVANVDSMHANGGYKNQWWSRYNYQYFSDSAEATAFQRRTPYTSGVRKAQGNYRVGSTLR